MLELRGDPSLEFTQISLKGVERLLKKERHEVMIEVNQVQNVLSLEISNTISAQW